MRSGPNTRRPMRRGGGNNSNNNGNNNRRGGSPRTQNFESNGPDIKVRGNAQQIVDKYQTLAREAATAGNPVMAENYYQHAEHYHRVLTASGGGENRQNNRQPEGDANRNNDNNQNNQNNQQQANQANPEQNVGQSGEGVAVEPVATAPDPNTSPASSPPREEAKSKEDSSAESSIPVVPTTPAEIAAAVDDAVRTAPSETTNGADTVKKPRRKRAPRTAKPAEIVNEVVAAASSEGEPAPVVADPVVEKTEVPVKAAS